MALTWEWPLEWPIETGRRHYLLTDDRHLIERAREGDADAFGVLFEHYHAPILNYLNRMVGDRALAEDLTQDTFIKAYKSLPKTSPDLAFKAWLYRIATNTAISHLRRGKIVRWLPFVGEHETRAERIDSQVTRTSDISAALDRLPKHYASILLLRHYQGLSLAETAQALDITENAAKLRLFRARKAFAKIYEDEPMGDVGEEDLR
ncbi:MAG: RNA polymerase sigma factor [Thermomicrobiales bacterium]|nr:RNA polymerase sigma factor [Thermomicrobiales bacterium]